MSEAWTRPIEGGSWSELSISYQSLVGHVSLILQLNQPPLQLVPGSLGLLPQLLLSLQTLPLHLNDRHLERVQGGRSAFLPSEWWRTAAFPLATCFLALSSLAWAFICWTSSESTHRRRINRSWFPMHSCRICSSGHKPAVIMNASTTALFISHIQAASASVSAQLTSLLTRKRDELNLKTFVFLSRGLMVNCTFKRLFFNYQQSYSGFFEKQNAD